MFSSSEFINLTFLVIDYLDEICIGSDQFLNVIEHLEYHNIYSIKKIKSNGNDSFAVASNQIIKFYAGNSNGTFQELFEVTCPLDDYFSCMDISKHEKEICSISKKESKLNIFQKNSK